MAIKMKLSDNKKLKQALELMAVKAKNSAILSVGFRKGSTEADGTPTPLVAFLNEFGKTVVVKNPKGDTAGTYFQMPRPFFRNMIAKEQKHWGKDLGVLLKHTEFDAVKALELLGEQIAGQLQESIQELETPPLAPSTIKKKGFSKPLIDTSAMWKNVTYWVDDTTGGKE